MKWDGMGWQFLGDKGVPWHDMERDVMGRHETAGNRIEWNAPALRRTSASQGQVVNARLCEHLAALAECVRACHLCVCRSALACSLACSACVPSQIVQLSFVEGAMYKMFRGMLLNSIKV